MRFAFAFAFVPWLSASCLSTTQTAPTQQPDFVLPTESPPAAVRLEPLPNASPSGGNVVLARDGARMLAIVSDADADAVHVVDIDGMKEIASKEVLRPGQALVLRDGRIAVSSRQDGAVYLLVLEQSGKLRVERTIATSGEPVAIALSPDDRTILTAIDAPPSVDAYDTSTGTRRLSVALRSSPSAVTIDPEGLHALVASATASDVMTVALSNGVATRLSLDVTGQDAEPAGSEIFERDERGKGEWHFGNGMWTLGVIQELSAIRLRARHASAFADVAEVAYMAHELLVPSARTSEEGPDPEPKGYGGSEKLSSSELFGVSILDKRKGSRISFHPAEGACRLPRGQVFDSGTKHLYVACAGTNNAVALVWSPNVFSNGQYLTRRPASFRVVSATPLPAPGDGIALDVEHHRLVVSTLFGDRLVVRDLDRADDGKATSVVTLARSPSARPRESSVPSDAFERGQALFYRANDPRIASDGRACASCHIDGLSDNLEWRTKRGMRSTPVLAGRLEHAGAFGWNGESSDLTTHIAKTITKNLGGKGLATAEVEDLAVYIRKIAAPTRRRTPLAARGEEVFRSASTGCSSCHLDGGRGTDAAPHRLEASRRPTFLTPSLTGLARSAPYFHDGRYATLDELLTKTDGTMGSTSALSADERFALLAYLESL